MHIIEQFIIFTFCVFFMYHYRTEQELVCPVLHLVENNERLTPGNPVSLPITWPYQMLGRCWSWTQQEDVPQVRNIYVPFQFSESKIIHYKNRTNQARSLE